MSDVETFTEVLFVEAPETKKSTVRDTFSSRADIDQLLDKLDVREVSEGTGDRIMWEFQNEEHPDDTSIKVLFEGKSDDRDLDSWDQASVDTYMDAIFEAKQGLTQRRAEDTGIMDAVNKRVLELVQTNCITDASQLDIRLIKN
tara:strand:- start:2583 stop:3014 length:432 start_codon:yes stop_codon:yes gene_type:complete